MSSPDENARRSPAGVLRGASAELGGFKKFILRGNVVDLAVGIVIGAAFGNVVQALVKDLITPFLGAAGGVPDFTSWVVQVGAARLLVGDFLNALLSFLLIALVVYFLIVMPVTKLMDRYKTEPQPAPTKGVSGMPGQNSSGRPSMLQLHRPAGGAIRAGDYGDASPCRPGR